MISLALQSVAFQTGFRACQIVILRNHFFRNNTAKTLDLETCELPPYLVTDHKYEQMQMSGGSNYPFPKIPIPSLSSKYKVHFIKMKGNNYFPQIIYIVPVCSAESCNLQRSKKLLMDILLTSKVATSRINLFHAKCGCFV